MGLKVFIHCVSSIASMDKPGKRGKIMNFSPNKLNTDKFLGPRVALPSGCKGTLGLPCKSALSKKAMLWYAANDHVKHVAAY